MYKKDLSNFVVGALLTFVVVGSFGFLCVNSLKSQASLVASDTLPGLIYAGAANNRMEDNFLSSLYLTDLKTSGEQEKCWQRIEATSKVTDLCLKKYEDSIFDAADRSNYETLVAAREHYVKDRRQFFDLIRKGRREEALGFFKANVEPAYDKYKTAGTVLFDYNVKEGESRGRRLLKVSYATPFIVAIFGVVIFMVGSLVGLKITLP